MAYTPPTSAAVDVTWLGDSAYTPPASSEVDVSWQETTYTLTCTAAAIPVSSPAVSLARKYVLTAEAAGDYVKPGYVKPGYVVSRRVAVQAPSATLRWVRALVAQPAAVSVDAASAVLRASRALVAQPASVPVTASAAQLVFGVPRDPLVCTPHAVSVGAGAARLAVSRRISATAQAVQVAAGAARLAATRVLRAETHSAPQGFEPAALRLARRLVAEPGAFDVLGADAVLRSLRSLVAQPGSIVVGFTSADFVHARDMRIVRPLREDSVVSLLTETDGRVVVDEPLAYARNDSVGPDGRPLIDAPLVVAEEGATTRVVDQFVTARVTSAEVVGVL